MSKTMKLALVVCAVVALFAAEAAIVAQDLHPSRRSSPMGLARTTVGDAFVSVTYSRPYVRGREVIFGTEDEGALVPFGQVWRTGANEATQVTVTEDVKVAGETLPAGTYSLLTVPGPEKWSVHFNSRLGLWGTMGTNPETGNFEPMFTTDEDVLVVEAASSSLDEAADQFTISFEEMEDSTHMILRWADTEVRVPITSAT